MKKLLSLPPNLVGCFYDLLHVTEDEWFCTSDPEGTHLGSGGGTAWLLETCRRKDAPHHLLKGWLPQEKRILLHAGGESRRLPAYAPSGKILTPIPVFRWERGQRLGQNLLSLQMPLYEAIMEKAPASMHTLVASGDVYIRTNEPLQPVPEADVVCYGLWADTELAMNHGVFFSRRETPDVLDFMLQKPSTQDLDKLAKTHLFLMDIGIWLLSDRAVNLLVNRSRKRTSISYHKYDLYSDFGQALGENPSRPDEHLCGLTVKILPLPGGEFYHYGTSRELISSTLAVQNLVADQRAIMQRKVKPHPAIFVQNAEVHVELNHLNAGVWIENSCIGPRWTLYDRHILTGIPENDWKIDIPSGYCIDVVPIGETDWVARVYKIDDTFNDLGQYALLYPVCHSIKELGEALKWMISRNNQKENRRGQAIWNAAEKLSASNITARANLRRLTAQRDQFRLKNWPLLAAHHEKSVFYQLDLADAAAAFARHALPLPETLPEEAPLMKRIHNHMFRAKALQLSGQPFAGELQQAFGLLREGMAASLADQKQSPHLSVHPDQIVWGRSPVRIDLAGGWTDTPPYCLYAGGRVVNVAIELNGQPPLQVYVKPCEEFCIMLRSIDGGKEEKVKTWEELASFDDLQSAFSIPKAALALAGFLPAYSQERFRSLKAQLQSFGAGLELTLLSAVPAGSGLGTSSILAATVLGALSDFCGLGWDKNEIGRRTLVLEQLLTSGGGWQDQFGGILHGLKLLETPEGFSQSPVVRWLPDYLFTDAQYRPLHLLYYTGQRRLAKDILAEIVQSMFLNSGPHLRLLADMKAHAMDMYDAIQYGDFASYGALIGKTWEQNKAIDAGTNPASVEQLISLVKDYTLGYKLPGAGGGGYLYMVAKDAEAAARIRRTLTENCPNRNARFVEMHLSQEGLQVSRS